MEFHQTQSSDDELDEAVVAFIEAMDRGEEPQASDWLRRYPHLGIELADFFSAYPVKRATAPLAVSSILNTIAHPANSIAANLEAMPGMPNPFPGEFRFIRLLGEGAFGKVYLADDLNLGWQVAIKTLKVPVDSTHGPNTFSALKMEAQQLARLSHPNIVRVHAWREAGGEYFLVQQFVAGGSLADRLKSETQLCWQDAAKYVADVGEALVEAHARGIVHRDIKPENILWDAKKDEAMLTDFGVSARLAEPGSVAGTPIYMAPEAFSGETSPALDVYSLAATLFRLATGAFPFTKGSISALVSEKAKGLPTLDSRCFGIPEPIERVIRAGLVPDPAKRLSLNDFVVSLRSSLNKLLADDLASWANESPPIAPPQLRMHVSRLNSDGRFERLACTSCVSSAGTRDMKRVPRPPEKVQLRTGDRVQIDVEASQTGSLVVLNVGPTGNLNLLYPDEPATHQAPDIGPDRSVQIRDVEIQPPTGTERLVAIWTRGGTSVLSDHLYDIIRSSAPDGSAQYRSTRDMKRLKGLMKGAPESDRISTVIELDHL